MGHSLENLRKIPSPLVVGIGEALFDQFDDHFLLGGAPVNFAFHANQLLQPVGGRGVVVSRVGMDELANELRGEFSKKGLDDQYLQADPVRATGVVSVELDDAGQPTYHITKNVAWDHLEVNETLTRISQQCDAVCFGTLAQRSPTSRRTIQSIIRNTTHGLRVFDLNLRQTYFDAQVVRESLELANVVKLNEEELQICCELLGYPDCATTSLDDLAFLVCQAFQLRVLALTRGCLGTLLFTSEQRYEGQEGRFDPHDDADSVGAGDGCCAALVIGLLLDWPLEKTLYLANQIGAFIATQPGATPELPKELISLVSTTRTL